MTKSTAGTRPHQGRKQRKPVLGRYVLCTCGEWGPANGRELAASPRFARKTCQACGATFVYDDQEDVVQAESADDAAGKAAEADGAASAAPAACSGGRPCNTAPRNQPGSDKLGRSPAFDPGLLHAAGIDSIYLSVYGAYLPWELETLAEKLDALLDEMKETGETETFFTLDDGTPVAFRGGSGKGFGHARWTLIVDGIKYRLTDRTRSEQEGKDGKVRRYPVAYVEADSLAMLEHGFVGYMAAVGRVLQKLGLSVTGLAPSRVDVSIDLPDVAMHKVVERWRAGHVVTRANKTRTFERKTADGPVTESLYFGTGDVQVRCYDKLAELREKDDGEKLQLMVDRRWGYHPDEATRVELQLRRDWLRDRACVATLQELCEKLRSICEYMTAEWLRITARTPTKGKESTCPLADVWRRVRGSIEEFFGTWVRPLVPRKPRLRSPRESVAQVRGWLVRFLAEMRQDATDFVDGLKKMASMFEVNTAWLEEEPAGKFTTDLITKRTVIDELRAASPSCDWFRFDGYEMTVPADQWGEEEVDRTRLASASP